MLLLAIIFALIAGFYARNFFGALRALMTADRIDQLTNEGSDQDRSIGLGGGADLLQHRRKL